MAEKNFITIKLVVNKVNNQLVFAECDKDFVEVLFSFLTLPISSIINLSQNIKSNIGCIDTLYQSVESLDTQYFETECCKSMLLLPKSTFEAKFANLGVDYYTKKFGTGYYICDNWECVTNTQRDISLFKSVKCHCGQEMDCAVELNKKTLTEDDGVFVKGIDKFIITDDLRVRKASAQIVDVKDGACTETRTVFVDLKKVLNLLSHSLMSKTKTPLSDVFLPKKRIIKSNVIKIEPLNIKPQVPVTVLETKKVSVVLFIRKPRDKALFLRKKRDEKVLYAVAKEDFLNFLLSILAFPVGSVINLLGGNSSIGSISNVYNSVEDLCKEDHKKFKKCKRLLLRSKVARHHGYDKQLLNMKEDGRLYTHHVPKCSTCFREGIDVSTGNLCKHGFGNEQLKLINPKHLDTVCESGGGFIKKSVTFMVTDELTIKPHSRLTCKSYMKKLGVPLCDIEERVVTVGEQEALSLLKALLTSKKALTDVFCKKIEDKY